MDISHGDISHFITFFYFQYRIILPLLNTISKHLHSGVFISYLFKYSKNQTNTYSQLNDEDHLCPALKNIFESHDVLMLKAL